MSDVFDQVEKEYVARMKAAFSRAAKKATEAIKQDYKEQVIDMAVKDYYDEYDPKRYKDRTYSLYDIFEINVNINGDIISVGSRANSDMIPQHYSNSRFHKSGGEWKDYYSRSNKGNNGMPDSEWIFGNFIEGIHPGWWLHRGLGMTFDYSYYGVPIEKRIDEYNKAYEKSGSMESIVWSYLINEL